MTKPEALSLVAKLAAAFPHPKVEPATVAVYAEAFEKLRLYPAAVEAVERLIVSERMLPRIADVYETYHSLKDRHQPPGLPEAPMSDEQIAENKRQAQAMVERLAKGLKSMPPTVFR